MVLPVILAGLSFIEWFTHCVLVNEPLILHQYKLCDCLEKKLFLKYSGNCKSLSGHQFVVNFLLTHQILNN